MVDEAGRNMKKLFDVTNTLLGRTTPTQFPCSTDGVPLPERFNTFFVDTISRIICRIDARAEPTVTEFQAPRLHGDDTLPIYGVHGSRHQTYHRALHLQDLCTRPCAHEYTEG